MTGPREEDGDYARDFFDTYEREADRTLARPRLLRQPTSAGADAMSDAVPMPTEGTTTCLVCGCSRNENYEERMNDLVRELRRQLAARDRQVDRLLRQELTR
jgi:hypothetical protein